MLILSISLSILAGGLIRSRRTVSLVLFLSSITLALYGSSVEFWIARLGTDSFAEAHSFSIQEAVFFLGTVGEILRLQFQPVPFGLVLLTFAGAMVWTGLPPTSHALGRNRVYTIIALSMLLLLASMATLWHGPLRSFAENTSVVRNYEKVFQHSKIPEFAIGNPDLNLVIYIGESTSVMNMALYGYHRNTTPRLSALARDDDGMIVFRKVSSTHTHTTPSLAEALSLAACEWAETEKNHESCPPTWRQLPIDEQSRISLIDVLIHSGREVRLFSNQNQSGSWSAAANVIFRNARGTYSVASRSLGNVEPAKPFDGDFFRNRILPCLEGRTCPKDAPANTIVLHSYAGHGPYRQNIPEAFRHDVDDEMGRMSVQAVVGKAGSAPMVENVEAYDSAVRYIDAVVSEQIEAVKIAARPTVLVYFSDHGDSSYTGRGHDSSRYIHEMTRVPFIIYFNPSARDQYPSLYERYVNLAKQESPTTLRQLAPTILDLLSARPADPAGLHQHFSSAVIGERSEQYPVLVRRTLTGVTSIDLVYTGHGKGSFFDNADRSSVAFAVSNAIGRFDELCSHRSNSIARIRRGTLVGTCIEFDVTEVPGGDLKVFHAPARDVGFGFAAALQMASKARVSVWIDAKSFLSAKSCRRHEEVLIDNIDLRTVFLELPSSAHMTSDPEFVSCVKRLVSRGVSVSHYVPTSHAINCAQALKQGSARSSVGSCVALERDVVSALESGMFTDISFDYRGMSALEGISGFDQARKNTWFIPPDELYGTGSIRFHNVILRSDEVNYN